MSVCDIYRPVKSLRVCTKKAEWINDEYLELRRKSMRAKHLANIHVHVAKNGELYGTAKVLRNRLNNLGVKLMTIKGILRNCGPLLKACF